MSEEETDFNVIPPEVPDGHWLATVSVAPFAVAEKSGKAYTKLKFHLEKALSNVEENAPFEGLDVEMFFMPKGPPKKGDKDTNPRGYRFFAQDVKSLCEAFGVEPPRVRGDVTDLNNWKPFFEALRAAPKAEIWTQLDKKGEVKVRFKAPKEKAPSEPTE